MALIGNYSLGNRVVGRKIGAGVSLMVAENYSPPSSWKNRLTAFGQLSGTPYGYLAPISWVLPNTPGAMRIVGSSESIGLAIGAAGRAIEASSTSDSSGDVLAGAIVPIIADGLSSSTSSVIMAGAAEVISTGSASSSGSALVGGIINILDITGSGNGSGSCNLTALAHLIAEAGGPTALSPEGLAQAVWGTLSSDYLSASGTFGYQLANSGTGLSPIDIANAVWDKDLSTLKASELVDFLEFINTKVNELHKIQGLDSASPMTVTESNRVAGSITQNFTGDGISTTTVTRV